MRPYPTVSNRLHRLLMLWFIIALQAMTPFIHAHAGSMQLNHAEFLHVHQVALADTCHVVSNDAHGAKVEVAHGMPQRHTAPNVANADASFGAAAFLLPKPTGRRQDAALSAPLHSPSLDHALPYALAPPRS